MPDFHVVSPYQPAGDQPQAIEALAKGVELGLTEQTLLGVTGSGKTFTMAKVIEQVQRPTLVLAHNKTLAAQLCAEFKEFFPDNAVEYFVSYYDYYQPEAYIPHTDTFIEKDSAVNDEIERRRAKQDAFNQAHGIVPKTIIKSVRDVIELSAEEEETEQLMRRKTSLTKKERDAAIEKLEREMREASKRLEFEYAAVLRDRIIELRGR